MSTPLSKILPIASEKCVRTNEEYQFQINHITVKDWKQHLLVTDGLSNNEQDVNEDNADLKRIELYMLLPEYWNIDTISWPIDWLEKIARVPQKNNTWFGHGDTIPAGNPPQELDPKLSANHFMITRPITLEKSFKTSNSQQLNFQLLSVIPIFQKELDYKLLNSHSMLLKKFLKKNVTEELDLYRTSSCGKRVLGLF